MQIHITNSPAEDAARHLNTLLDEYRMRDVLLLFSGGSALALLPHIDTTPLTERDTLSVIDERYTFDVKNSNMSALVTDPFWERARKQHVQVIDPRPAEGEDLLDSARRFDIALKEWHITHHDGVVIAIMGMGIDGHTAGILPHPHNPETFEELFQDIHRTVRGYHVDAKKSVHQDRMTVTNTYLLRHVNHALLYVVGNEKRAALEATLAEDGSLHQTPARIIHALQDVSIYTDLPVSYESKS